MKILEVRMAFNGILAILYRMGFAISIGFDLRSGIYRMTRWKIMPAGLDAEYIKTEKWNINGILMVSYKYDSAYIHCGHSSSTISPGKSHLMV